MKLEAVLYGFISVLVLVMQLEKLYGIYLMKLPFSSAALTRY